MMTIERLSVPVRFAVMMGFMAVVLLGMIGKTEWRRAQSVAIILETAPVDPRSMFQGDYVTLSYKIGTPASSMAADDGETIYTVLAQDEKGLWQAVRTSPTWPEDLQPDQRVIRGTVQYRRIIYGIEAFFVPEEQGRWIEQIRDRSRVTVRVLLDPEGHAQMDALLVDGQEVFAPTGLVH